MNFKNLKGDIFGGVTAGIVALPLALAFGVQSGLGAIAGLYGAIALGLLSAILGGTKTQISGPTGPMTVVSATFIAMAIAKFGGIESAWGIIILCFLLAGLFQIVFGLLKVGEYVKFIPYPVLSGFMTGIGLIIIALQILPAMGLVSPSKIIDVFREIPSSIAHCNPVSLLITASSILIIYIFPRISKVVPGALIALLFTSAAAWLFKLEVPLIGEIPSGLPSLKLASLSSLDLADLHYVIFPAIALAGLGAIDSLLTSVVADNMTRTKHNSNKELIGQGIGNMAAALLGGIPGAGATMRTVVNIKSGGKTRISGVIHALFLMLILLGLGRYVAYIPIAALAGVLISVGISILDLKGIKNIFKIPKSDAFILILVIILTVFVDLLQAVGIGMVLASLVFMKKASIMVEQNSSLTRVDKYDREIPWEDETGLALNQWESVYIKRFDGPMFFGVAAKMLDRVNKIPEDARVIIFRMKRVPWMDQSGLHAFEQVVKEMDKMGIVVVLTMTQAQPLSLFQKTRLVPEIIPEKHLFKSIEDCSKWLKEHNSKSVSG
jgi:sulfate permease, SulP family